MVNCLMIRLNIVSLSIAWLILPFVVPISPLLSVSSTSMLSLLAQSIILQFFGFSAIFMALHHMLYVARIFVSSVVCSDASWAGDVSDRHSYTRY